MQLEVNLLNTQTRLSNLTLYLRKVHFLLSRALKQCSALRLDFPYFSNNQVRGHRIDIRAIFGSSMKTTQQNRLKKDSL